MHAPGGALPLASRARSRAGEGKIWTLASIAAVVTAYPCRYVRYGIPSLFCIDFACQIAYN